MANTMGSLLALAATIGCVAIAAPPSTFEQIVPQYENIRVDLLFDETERVAESAKRIQGLAQQLADGFSIKSAGVSKNDTAAMLELIPAIREAAGRLSETKTLEAARAAFGDLSDSLIAYRNLLANPESVVVYCSMAQKSWIQPKGEIGNPYFGQSMAQCGEIVADSRPR